MDDMKLSRLCRFAPQVWAQFRPGDACCRFDGQGARWGDGVHPALIPTRGPLVDSPGRHAKLLGQLGAGPGGMDRFRYRVRVHGGKFGTDSSESQARCATDSSEEFGHDEGMETRHHFSARLKLALDHHGVTTRPVERKRYLALLTGVSERHAGNYLAGEKLPTSEGIIALAGKLGVSHEWLATGRGPMLLPGLTDAQAEILSRLSAEEKERLFRIGQLLGKDPPATVAA